MTARLALFVLAVLLCARQLSAFPAVYVGKDFAPRVARTTHIVLMVSRENDLVVMTMMPDYAGPIADFALVMPVPSDVKTERVRIVRRNFLDRVEKLTAPRYHAFYEQDPCLDEPVPQDWEVHHFAEVDNPLFSADAGPSVQRGVPPELLLPREPIFKGGESEFRISVLPAEPLSRVQAHLAKRGYRLDERMLEALAGASRDFGAFLVAEVRAEHVELVSTDEAQLGGIRIWSRRMPLRFPLRIGLGHVGTLQDVFFSVFHPERRFEVKNYGNVFLPTNLVLGGDVREQVAVLHNALFDKVLALKPQSFVHEHVWPSDGCGEPCPDEPFQLRELLTLGGDVLDSELVQDKGSSRRPPAASSLSAPLTREQKELAERRKLIERQRYVVSRIHYRYDQASLPHDPVLGPADRAVEGGVGVPRGPNGDLVHTNVEANAHRYQTRFVGLEYFEQALRCDGPQRFRWGKRWDSLSRLSRKASLGRDLARKPRDAALLEQSLRTPLPELGLYGVAPGGIAPPSTPTNAPSSSCACSHIGRAAGVASLLWPVVGLLALGIARWRRHRHSASH